MQSTTYATTIGAANAGLILTGFGTNAIFIDNCLFAGQNSTVSNCLQYGLYIDSADGAQISNSFFSGTHGIFFNGLGAAPVDDVYFVNCLSDNNRETCVTFNGAQTNYVYTNIRFVGCHFNAGNYNGTGLSRNIIILGTVDYVQFNACNINLSSQASIAIAAHNSYTGEPRRQIKFTGCDITANATAGGASSATVYLESGVTGVSFIDCALHNRPGSEGQAAYAIILDGNNSRIKIIGCDLLPVTNTPIYLGGGTFSDLHFSGNVGLNDYTSPLTVSALGVARAGMRATVSDATATAFSSVVAGGGSNTVPVWHDGTNWRIG